MNNLIDLICCPNCQGDLIKDNLNFFCNTCKSNFREKEGILILISKELEYELRG